LVITSAGVDTFLQNTHTHVATLLNVLRVVPRIQFQHKSAVSSL